MRITKKNSVSVSGIQPGSGASATQIDTAVFDLSGSHGTGDWEVVRLANGSLSKVEGLPKGAKLHYLSMTPRAGANAAGSSYIYTRLGNKIYRAGATGNFTKFFDGGGLTLPNGSKLKKFLDRGFTLRTNHCGEFAAAAEDSSGQHWIIELNANGTEKRRTKAKGKISEDNRLHYVDF